MCTKSPECRKVGDTLTATVTGGAGTATYQWLADGKEIVGEDTAILLVTEDLIGTKLSVTVTDEDGDTATSEETALVKSDKSGVFELLDDNGFQADGTALTTDTLRVSYGSDLGTPSIITWYNDGAVMSIYSLANGNLTQASFNSNNCRSKNGNTELATGNWKVLIENTKGELWTSNEVEVVYDGTVVMTAVSIEDDYETPMTTTKGVEINTKTSRAIINVSFNKNYKGTMYLVNSKYEKGYDDTTSEKGKNKIAMTGTNGIEGYLNAKVNTLAGLTNKKASANGKGAYYEDATGGVHAKFVVALAAGEQVKRGDSYYLIFDQDDLDTDNFSTTAEKDDLNTSDDMVVPYVIAPASIAVTSFTEGTKTPQITLYDEDGAALTWWNSSDAASDTITGFESIKLYGVDSNETSASDTATTLDGTATLKMDKGVAKVVASSNISKKYIYAKFKTEAGIFAESSETFTSELAETARKAVDSVTLKEDSTDPYAAVVELKGLSSKAPGTVYILQGKSTAGTAETFADIAEKSTDDAIASAKVEGGASKVTIGGVFKSAWTAPANEENMFVAVYVPDDTELWQSAKGLNDDGDGFTLKATITSSDKSDMTAKLAVGSKDAKGETSSGAADGEAAAINIEVTGIQLLDQFGKKWKGDADAVGLQAVDVSATKVLVAHSEGGSGKLTYDANGVAKLEATVTSLDKAKAGADSVFDKGETWTFKVAGLAGLTVTAKTKATVRTSANRAGATVTSIQIDSADDNFATTPTTVANGSTDIKKAFNIG